VSIIPVTRRVHRGIVNVHRTAATVFEKTNALRRHYGLRGLTWHHLLADVALRHTEDMIRREFVGHVNPDGFEPIDRLARQRPELIADVGENLAVVPAGPSENVGEELCARWMASEGHRRNLLAPSFTHVGVAIVTTDRRILATQLLGHVHGQILLPKTPFLVHGSRPSSVILTMPSATGRIPVLWALSPDADTRFSMVDGSTVISAYPLPGTVRNGVLQATFLPRTGPGAYRLMLGSAGERRAIRTHVRLVAR
jgi:hypothetical protein